MDEECQNNSSLNVRCAFAVGRSHYDDFGVRRKRWEKNISALGTEYFTQVAT